LEKAKKVPNCSKDVRSTWKYVEPSELSTVWVRFTKTVKGLEGLPHYLNNNSESGKKLEANLQISEKVNLFKIPAEYRKFTLFRKKIP